MDGAFREAREELSGIPDDLPVTDRLKDDHGGWSYTTVIARSTTMFDAGSRNWETGDQGYVWASFDDAAALPLHPGFEGTWALVRNRLRHCR